MSYVIVNRFTLNEDMIAGTYNTPKDLYLAITGYSKTGQNFITTQETSSGILLDSAKRDSIISTLENASYVIVDDYVSVDRTWIFDTEAHFDEFENWKTLQIFNDDEHFVDSRSREDIWTRLLISEG